MGKVINVQSYIDMHEFHAEILNKLRSVLLNYPFEEVIKCGILTYVIDNKNPLQ